LVGVVGDVAGEVRVDAVALPYDAILVVPLALALEEERSVPLLEGALPLELGERGVDAPPAVQALLARPHVEDDAEVRERALDARQDARSRHAVEHPRHGRA